MKKLALILLMVLCFMQPADAQEINSQLFGQNHWMAKSDEGNRPGYLHLLWPKVKESGVKTVRIGGNGYEHRFPDNNTLIAMIDSIQGIGAEPILQVPSDYSEEEVTALVRFLNHKPERKPVLYWSIGNEPLLRVRHDKELMLKKLDEVYQYLVRIATAMKAADPDLKIFVFDGCGLPEGNTEKLNYEAYEALCGGKLDITGMDKNGHWLVDGINFHNYPNRLDYSRDRVIFSSTYMIRQATQQLLELIDKANQKHGRTGNARLMWGLTEINVNAGNPSREAAGIGCPSFLGGQFIAEIYGIGMANGAFTVAPWCINETDRVRTDFGYIGLPSEFYPRSSYYHTQMMAHNMKGAFLPTKSSNSYVHTIGCQHKDQITVMILNRDQHNDFDFDLILKSDEDSGKPLVVHADVGIDLVIESSIPSQTTMMFVLSGTGEVIRKYTYGLSHNLKNLPPDVE